MNISVTLYPRRHTTSSLNTCPFLSISQLTTMLTLTTASTTASDVRELVGNCAGGRNVTCFTASPGTWLAWQNTGRVDSNQNTCLLLSSSGRQLGQPQPGNPHAAFRPSTPFLWLHSRSCHVTTPRITLNPVGCRTWTEAAVGIC